MKEEKKDKVAIALEYTPENDAPVVIATGKGALAEKILDGAKKEDIPVYHDQSLAKTLSKLELGVYRCIYRTIRLESKLYGAR